MCYDNNCDPEDVLQEVYKGILIRNRGKCPFDAQKSAFSTYVVMVSKCVTINYINKAKKKAQREVFGKEDSAEEEIVEEWEDEEEEWDEEEDEEWEEDEDEEDEDLDDDEE